MKYCSKCGKEMETEQKFCPSCGSEVSNQKKGVQKEEKKKGMPKWAIVLIVIFSIGIIGSALSDDETKSNSSNKSNDTNNVEEKSETVNKEESNNDNVPAEYKSALKKAESYSKIMHMSKAGIYDQLISEYGEQFPVEAAQYAVDNMQADWNANALAKAKDYQKTMSMSKQAIYDQLISEYGEKFTAEEAQYAIDNLS